MIADHAGGRCTKTELEVRVSWPWPETVLDIECRIVRPLRETEYLEIRVGCISLGFDCLLLVFARAGNDFDHHALALHLGPADSIDAPDLPLECRILRRELRIPQQVRELLGVRAVLEIGCAARRDVNRVDSIDPHPVRDNQPLVVERQRTDEGNPQLRWIDVVIDPLAKTLVYGAAPRPWIAEDPELRPAWIRRLRSDQQTIQEDASRSQRIGERHRELLHSAAVQNVDVRIRIAEDARRDREEESPRLELVILDTPIDGSERSIADREDAVANDISFLLRDNSANARRTDFSDSLKTVVAARNARGDETGCRRLEGHVAELDALNELVAFSLVIDGDVVRSVELALCIVIDVDVNSLSDDAARPCVELEIRDWEKGALTREHRLGKAAHRASLVQILLRTQLHPGIQLKRQVGMLGDDVACFRRHCSGLFVRRGFRKRWRLFRRGK